MINIQNKNPIAVLKETRKLKGYINQKLLTIFFVCLLGIILIIGFRDKFLTQYKVDVTKAILYPDDGDGLSDGNLSLTKKGSLLFQASGWIEPDPFPIRVASLYSGVVKEVHVLEGQQIKKGEIIATLIDEDARLVLAEMNAKHSQSIAEEAIIEADLELANAGLEAALSKVSKDEALLQENNDTVDRMSSLPKGAISEQAFYQAKLGLKRQLAELSSSNSEVSQQRALIKKLRETLVAQTKKTEIFSVQKQKAELDLKRTKITSPINGIILRLLAKPGSRIMLDMDDKDAAAAAILYEGGKLQARIDVPLSEAAKINLGQMVEITSSILPEKVFRGKISRILGEADLQRNTLQVKVSLIDTHPRLRPEMLCRAKFFGMSSHNKEDSSQFKIFINKNLFKIGSVDSNSEKELWVISNNGKTCEKRRVSIGGTIRGKYISVVQGLLAGEAIILNPPEALENGDRVEITKIK
jgi:HlyD family secretion protein